MHSSFRPHPLRGIASIQLLVQLGIEQGVAFERSLAGTGLTPFDLANGNHEITAEQELRVVRNLQQALPHEESLGLLAAQRYQLTTYGIWGYAMLSSPTFRNAAELGMRYLGLTFAFTRIHLLEEGDLAHIAFDSTHLPADVHDFCVQRDLFAVLVIQRELTGMPLPLQAARLALPAPADLTPFARQLGLTPTFGASQSRLSFERWRLDEPLPRANPQLAAQCEAQCQALLQRRCQRDGLAGQVRERLLERPGQLPDMPALAAQLGLSERSLRRQLAAEGSSFRQLLEEVRQTLAEELLATGGLNLEEIAYRLGYGETSNFIHAFKRWKGMPPGQYLTVRAAPSAQR